MPTQPSYAKRLARTVFDRRSNDIRQAFRDAINAKVDAAELAKQTNAELGEFVDMRVEFQDQPGNRWLIKVVARGNVVERIVVF